MAFFKMKSRPIQPGLIRGSWLTFLEIRVNSKFKGKLKFGWYLLGKGPSIKLRTSRNTPGHQIIMIILRFKNKTNK